MDILSAFFGAGIGFLVGVISGATVFALCMINKNNAKDLEEQIMALSPSKPQLDEITAQDLANDYNCVPTNHRR